MDHRQVRFLKLAIVISASVILGACQTSPNSNETIPNVKFAKNVIPKMCVFAIGIEGHDVHKSEFKKVNETRIHIDSISKGQDGWWRIGYWLDTFHHYVFLNSDNQSRFCGERNFKSRGYQFKKVDQPIADDALLIAFENSAVQKPREKNHSRDKNQEVCLLAVQSDKIEWEIRSSMNSYVKEAKRRNLTPQECAKLIGR